MEAPIQPGDQDPGKEINDQQQVVNEQDQGQVINPTEKNYEKGDSKEKGYEQGIRNDNITEEKGIKKSELPEATPGIPLDHDDSEKEPREMPKGAE